MKGGGRGDEEGGDSVAAQKHIHSISPHILNQIQIPETTASATCSYEGRTILEREKHLQIYNPGTFAHSEESLWKSSQTRKGSMGEVRCFRSSLLYESHEPES